MNQKILDSMMKIAELFFGTETDPDQMPINQESADKLLSIHKNTIVYKIDENGNPIAWVVVVPTSINVMNQFLKKEITEKELLDKAVEEKKFDTLYLCAAFVLPEYRRKGYAKELFEEAINGMPNGNNATLYCWLYSEDGKKLVAALSGVIKRPILSRD